MKEIDNNINLDGIKVMEGTKSNINLDEIEELNRTNFKFELITKIKIKYSNFIRKIIELPQDKIGILCKFNCDKSIFLIYSSKTFKMIKQFELFFNDAVKTEDNNLVLSNKYNIYYYELIDKEYKLIQEIQCYEIEEISECSLFGCGYRRDSIDFIHPLKNGNLIVINGKEMKIYKKDNGKFIYDKTLNCDYYIQKKIFEIKPNIIVLFSMENAGSSCCVETFYYSISLYNIQNGEKN